MREFLILINKGTTNPNFDIKRLYDYNRLDVAARVTINSLCISNGLRDDTIVHLSLLGQPYGPKLVSFHGSKLKEFTTDEYIFAKLLQKALNVSKNFQMGEKKDLDIGVSVSKISFEEFVKTSVKEKKEVIYLDEKGNNYLKTDIKEDFLCILGDHSGIPQKTKKFLENNGAKKISLGPVMLLASQCVVVLHNHLDNK